MLGDIDYYLRDSSRGFQRITLGQVPDGSGNLIGGNGSLVDYFFLPGRSGGQTATQADSGFAALSITQSSFSASGAELVRLTSDSGLIAMRPGGFSITCSTTISSPTLTTTASFLPTGGPSVTPGMLITGTGIPATTYVKTIGTSLSLTMTNDATATGTVAITFTTQVDIRTISDETGKDVEWLARGGVRFTPGTESIPFRISGDTTSIATGIAAAGRIYLESGYLTAGTAVGSEFQVGGPNRGELARMNVFSRAIYFTRLPSLGDGTFAFNVNPYEYGDVASGFGTLYSVHIQPHTSGSILIDRASGSPSGGTSALTLRSGPSGTSPNKAVSADIWWELMDNGVAKFRNGAGGGMDLSGITNALKLARVNGIAAVFDFSLIATSDKTFTFPNVSGTIPTLENAHTVTGAWTFDGTGGAVGTTVVTQAGGGGGYGLFLDDLTGFKGELSVTLLGLSANRIWTLPDATAQLVGNTETVTLTNKTLSTNTNLSFLAGTDTRCAFQDSATPTKQLTLDLSGVAASTLSILDFNSTAARTYSFENLSGSVAIVGNDPPAVASGFLGKVDLTAQTANIATTNLSSTPPTGVYAVEVYLLCTTADATAGTLAVTIGWTDNVGATTTTPITGFTLTATGRATGRQLVRVSSGDITYAVAVTGSYGTSQYAVYVRVVSLG